MSDPLQALLQGAAKPNLFPPNSRYYGIGTGTLTTADGKTIPYLQRRFTPPPEDFVLLQEYTVVQGDRLDNLAAKYVGDPERFWQICDANAAMSPEELTEIVRRILRITLPAGIPGNQNG
jgi:hypothetical protein